MHSHSRHNPQPGRSRELAAHFAPIPGVVCCTRNPRGSCPGAARRASSTRSADAGRTQKAQVVPNMRSRGLPKQQLRLAPSRHTRARPQARSSTTIPPTFPPSRTLLTFTIPPQNSFRGNVCPSLFPLFDTRRSAPSGLLDIPDMLRWPRPSSSPKAKAHSVLSASFGDLAFQSSSAWFPGTEPPSRQRAAYAPHTNIRCGAHSHADLCACTSCALTPCFLQCLRRQASLQSHCFRLCPSVLSTPFT